MSNYRVCLLFHITVAFPVTLNKPITNVAEVVYCWISQVQQGVEWFANCSLSLAFVTVNLLFFQPWLFAAFVCISVLEAYW